MDIDVKSETDSINIDENGDVEMIGNSVNLNSDSVNLNSDSDLEVKDSKTRKQIIQEENTQLREKFLRLLSGFHNDELSFQTCENTVVKGIFQACDSSFENIIVRDLKTPVMNYEHATLRVNDLISFHTFRNELHE